MSFFSQFSELLRDATYDTAKAHISPRPDEEGSKESNIKTEKDLDKRTALDSNTTEKKPVNETESTEAALSDWQASTWGLLGALGNAIANVDKAVDGAIDNAINSASKELNNVVEFTKRDLNEFVTTIQAETKENVGDLSLVIPPEVAATTELFTKEASTALNTAMMGLLNLGVYDHNGDDDSKSENNKQLSPGFHRKFIKSPTYGDPKTKWLEEQRHNMQVYCLEPDSLQDYSEWEVGFSFTNVEREVANIIESDQKILNLYKKLVPRVVPAETFWRRYFYQEHFWNQNENRKKEILKSNNKKGEKDDLLDWEDDADKSSTPSTTAIASPVITKISVPLQGDSSVYEGKSDNKTQILSSPTTPASKKTAKNEVTISYSQNDTNSNSINSAPKIPSTNKGLATSPTLAQYDKDIDFDPTDEFGLNTPLNVEEIRNWGDLTKDFKTLKENLLAEKKLSATIHDGSPIITPNTFGPGPKVADLDNDWGEW